MPKQTTLSKSKKDKELTPNKNMNNADNIETKGYTLETFVPGELLKKKLDSMKFITENSKDITYKLISYAQTCINRTDVIFKFSQLVQSHKIAVKLEKGIYEFALVHVTLNSFDKTNVLPIYLDKVNDIYMNLDKKSYMQNKTLLPAILNGSIDPTLVAFLSPQQLNSANWADIMNKKKYEEEAEHNMATTDLYRCAKCGERKCKITEMQIRSADECSTRFITCLICHNTFCK